MTQPFHLLAKPTGAICNLDCKYCFYLTKENLYPGSKFRMSDEVLGSYIRQLLDAQPLKDVYINWQGGEPTLMGLPFFEQMVALVERYQQPHQEIIHTLQTNGTQLNEAWGRFFKKHHFLVGLSLDGPESIHDYYRVDKKGRGSFAQVMQGWNILQRYQVDFNILCTVNAHNVQYPDVLYSFFRDRIQTPFIQFIPIIEKTGLVVMDSDAELVSAQSVPPLAYGKFLATIFDRWIEQDVGKLFVQDFEVALANWMHLQPSLCVFAETCGQALALEHTGDLYCCDHFVEPEYRLGNILTHPLAAMIDSPKQKAFGEAKKTSLPQDCLECDVRFACHGGCPKDRILMSSSGEPGLNYLCEGYQYFFRHITPQMNRLSQLMKLGYSPSAVMS